MILGGSNRFFILQASRKTHFAETTYDDIWVSFFSFIFPANCTKHCLLINGPYRIEAKYIKIWTRNTFTAYVKLASSCKSCIIIMMILSMSHLLTLFYNSTHFLSIHRFFSSSLSNQGNLHYWHLTTIIANSLRLLSSLSRFYWVAWLGSGTNISRQCILIMPF